MKKLIDVFQTLEKYCYKWDNYFPAYDNHISKYIGENPNVLEIGIAGGGSLEMWSKYFENGQIYGIDADEKFLTYKYTQDNIHIQLGDQSREDYWDSFIKNNPDLKYDVIIDDGSHIHPHQTLTLIKLFPVLNYGGTYVIEDTHTSYWPAYQGATKKPGTFIENMKDLIDLLHMQHISDTQPNQMLREIFKDIGSITFYNSMVIITKQPYENAIPIASDGKPFAGWAK